VTESLGIFAQWANAALRATLGAFITPGDTVDSHRDYGDETDFDVVTSQVNPEPRDRMPRIEPVVGISRADSIAQVLEHGVEVGDFRINADGSLEPVVPRPGHVNHTWVRVLLGELLIATGRDHESPDLATFPLRAADLLRDLVRS
jgi:hypothetical protein